MSPLSPIPSGDVVPGVGQFVELQRTAGLANLPSRVCLVGHRLTGASAALDEIPTQIGTRGDSQSRYGSGGQLDLMVRGALSTGPLARSRSPIGGIPEIWAVSVPPPAGVAAAYTITFGGAPTSNGTVVGEIGDQTFTIGTLTTGTPTTIAADFADTYALREPDSFLTGAALVAVVTLTGREAGTQGNRVYVNVNVDDAPGVTVTIAQTATGVGTVAIADALTASLSERFTAIVVAQDDATTIADVEAHIREAWQYDVDRPRHAYVGIGGTWTEAISAAATLDYYHTSVVSAEQIAGAGPPPFDAANSSRSMPGQAAAIVASMVYSQERPNFNWNTAPVPAFGRPNWVREDLNDAIKAGVLALIVEDGVTVIANPVTASITDQTGETAAPDTQWQPLEIPLTIREIWEQLRLVLAKFSQADRTPATLARSKTDVLGILRAAIRAGWITGVDEAEVTAVFATVGGRTDLLNRLPYIVVVGVDKVVATHLVTPNEGNN